MSEYVVSGYIENERGELVDHLYPSFVYAFYNGVAGLTKVGQSTDPVKRAKQLGFGWLVHFGPGDFGVEAAAHRIIRLSGSDPARGREWFDGFMPPEHVEWLFERAREVAKLPRSEWDSFINENFLTSREEIEIS